MTQIEKIPFGYQVWAGGFVLLALISFFRAVTVWSGAPFQGVVLVAAGIAGSAGAVGIYLKQNWGRLIIIGTYAVLLLNSIGVAVAQLTSTGRVDKPFSLVAYALLQIVIVVLFAVAREHFEPFIPAISPPDAE